MELGSLGFFQKHGDWEEKQIHGSLWFWLFLLVDSNLKFMRPISLGMGASVSAPFCLVSQLSPESFIRDLVTECLLHPRCRSGLDAQNRGSLKVPTLWSSPSHQGQPIKT